MPIHLRRSDENSADIDEAVERYGERVGLEHVLDHLNRQAVTVDVPGRLVREGFGWNDSDSRTRRWYPQGITTSADAGRADRGRRLLLTSWYSKGHQGSRVSVVDLDSLEYRHVLLVVPRRRRGRVVLAPLMAHAGGLVWCGPYLHVAGTRRGLFSCRLDDIIRLDSVEDGHGYRYVLPVLFGYDAHADDDTEQLRYSFLSLDRGSDPPQLLAGEYGRGDMTRRLVRYPLDPRTWHLDAHDDGAARPTWIDDRGVGHMQGACLVGDTYYVTTSAGVHRRGSLHVGHPGDWHTHRWALPIGPEDITYWPETDTFWSLTEHPGDRYVFSISRPSLPTRDR